MLVVKTEEASTPQARDLHMNFRRCERPTEVPGEVGMREEGIVAPRPRGGGQTLLLVPARVKRLQGCASIRPDVTSIGQEGRLSYLYMLLPHFGTANDCRSEEINCRAKRRQILPGGRTSSSQEKHTGCAGRNVRSTKERVRVPIRLRKECLIYGSPRVWMSESVPSTPCVKIALNGLEASTILQPIRQRLH